MGDGLCTVHLGDKVTLSLVKIYYWWVGMVDSARRWISRCYICQAGKSAGRTVRWRLAFLPFPSGPGQIVSFDLLEILQSTNRGNQFASLVADLFSRHAEVFLVRKYSG